MRLEFHGDAYRPGGHLHLLPTAEAVRKARQDVQCAYLYYENLFGLLFETELVDSGNRFRMTGRKVWPLFGRAAPKKVVDELPQHWWRRRRR